MKSQILREKFIKFFQKKGHKLLPASSLIPEDPSVLLTTAGMQQFKDWFSGQVKPKYKKVVTVQPCFRTSDIQLVGDLTHLTFFEMLGNFSFGGYFKQVAIKLAFEFLTKQLHIAKDKIKVSIFPGDKKRNLPLDTESFQICRQILPDTKILLGSSEDNFWGPTGNEGPCGPTCEIIVGDFELWNLVFNEYYQDKNGQLRPLKQKGVDTGMGLERLSAVMQGKDNVFQTDIYQPIFDKIRTLSNLQNEKSVRIIADHVRGIVFLAFEGILPSNKGQGYILRRLIRRLICHGQLLKFKPGFLKDLAKVVILQFGKIYPQMSDKSGQILNNLSLEEEKFSRTLQRGLSVFEKIKAKSANFKKISGADAFMLFDTFGFPLELTEELAQKENLKVDKVGFERQMEKQKEKARKAQKATLGAPNPKLHTACHLLHQALRDVLGPEASQAGQDISGDVLRFDFYWPQKLTNSQLQKIEKIVNQKIKQKLKITSKLTTVEQAKKEGAIALFLQKYGKKVTLYQIGNYSKELCAGPHVKNTGQLGHFKILSEKSAASGVRRIKAKLE